MTESTVAGTGSSETAPTGGRLVRLIAWSARVGLVRTLAFSLICLAILAGIGTYFTFVNAGPGGPDPEVVLGFLYLDLSLLLLLGALVGQHLVGLWGRRRQGLAGSKLHMRLVVMFSLVAVTPTILVAIFSMVLFDFAMKSWFSERIATAVGASRAVASSYLEEHKRNIKGDALALARDLNSQASVLITDPTRFTTVLKLQMRIRNLNEIVVFDSRGRALARAGLALSFDREELLGEATRYLRNGNMVILGSDRDRLRVIVHLAAFRDAYVYVSRIVNQEILELVEQVRHASTEYQQLEGRRFDIQITFAMIFAIGALLMLFAAIWIGLYFANWFARPVSNLIAASQRVSEGDLSAEIVEDHIGGFQTLIRSFNKMTRQLRAQRDDLVAAHHEQETRRRFTEAVLGGVSSAVIGIDETGRIDLPNRAAGVLLGIEPSEMAGRQFADILPEMVPLLADARQRPSRRAEDQIVIQRGGRHLALLARIVAEWSEGRIAGFVVTFDDITDLQSAQRKAAWADVARRIAHEIKNPLTPIQLAAERLKRKFGDTVADESGTFESLIDMIQRQVGDIGRMVDEFSDFARMPDPVMAQADLSQLLREQTVLQQTAHPSIRYGVALPDAPLQVRCDARQIRQAVTNLLQNAIDSISLRQRDDPDAGWIGVNAEITDGWVTVSVADNGCGLPENGRHRLTEPYVTTREKGTGLGLAIVRKIMEDHSGEIRMSDRPGGGAVVSLEFPVLAESAGQGTYRSTELNG